MTTESDSYRPDMVEVKPLTPLNVTIEQIALHLGLDTSLIVGCSSTSYGSGRTMRVGKEQGVGLTWYTQVWNITEEKYIPKTAPTVEVKSEHGFPGSYDLAIERVEGIEFIEGAVRFIGTTGKDEGLAQVGADGQVVFLAKPSARADEIPNTRKETKVLEGEVPEGYFQDLFTRLGARLEIVPTPED